jgi:hypothetical protein
VTVDGPAERYVWLRAHVAALGLRRNDLLSRPSPWLIGWVADRVELVTPTGRPVLLAVGVAEALQHNRDLWAELDGRWSA